MFSFRSNPLVALVAIAGLLSAQFATVTRAHVHVDETSVAGHAGRPHVHVGYGHSHSHAHAHKHAHGLHKHAVANSKAQLTAKRSVAVRAGLARAASEHDRDAVYVNGDLLCTTTQPTVIKSTSSAWLASAYLGAQIPTLQALAWYRLHPPDPAPPRAIYRLNQAILC